MRIAFLSLLFLITITSLYGQVREVISAAGETSTSNIGSLDWTLGEVFIYVNSEPQVDVVEGFWAPTEESFAVELLADLNPILEDIHIDTVYFSGEAISVTIDIANLGDIVSTGTFGRLYISIDTIIDEKDLDLGLYLIESIDYSDSLSITRQIVLPADLSSGDYYIIVKVDIFDDIIEYEEDNNVAFGMISIINLQEAPDLSIASYRISDQIVLNDSTELSYSVTNMGVTGSGDCDVLYYLSSDPILSDDDNYIGIDKLSSIAALSNIVVRTDLIIRDSTLIGNKYIIMNVDGLDKIIESQESNNIITIPVAIQSQDQTTSTEDYMTDSYWNISPNPATDYLQLEMNKEYAALRYHIVDITGEIVQSGSVNHDNILLHDSPVGRYQLMIYDRQKLLAALPFIRAHY